MTRSAAVRSLMVAWLFRRLTIGLTCLAGFKHVCCGLRVVFSVCRGGRNAAKSKVTQSAHRRSGQISESRRPDVRINNKGADNPPVPNQPPSRNEPFRWQDGRPSRSIWRHHIFRGNSGSNMRRTIISPKPPVAFQASETSVIRRQVLPRRRTTMATSLTCPWKCCPNLPTRMRSVIWPL